MKRGASAAKAPLRRVASDEESYENSTLESASSGGLATSPSSLGKSPPSSVGAGPQRRRRKKGRGRPSSGGSKMPPTVMLLLVAVVLFLVIYFAVIAYFLYRLESLEDKLLQGGGGGSGDGTNEDHQHLELELGGGEQQAYVEYDPNEGVGSKQSWMAYVWGLFSFLHKTDQRPKNDFYTVRERSFVLKHRKRKYSALPPDDSNNGSIPEPPLDLLPHNSTELVDMRQLTATLPFANEDGGVWKQGWDVQPRDVTTNATEDFKIFILPHSHCDPGWLKTFDEYFQTQTKGIITSVINALEKDPKRTFIWAEISYFSWWWEEQTEARRQTVKRLLQNKQLEFVTGGWVQPDEANSNMDALEIQMQEGHDWIASNIGQEFIPRYGWSIDPFGYSPSLPYLLKTQFDFDGILIQRVHYAVKKELAQRKHLEFYWRQTWDETGEYDMFTHLMPFYSYDVPHTCGPNPAVCCQFDYARRPVGQKDSCPWKKKPQVISNANLQERSLLLLDQYLKKANLYRGNAVLIPLGDDFRYQTDKEATDQFTNYQKIFDYINENVPGIQIQFGTLSQYFDTVRGSFKPPILKGSFFTYADVNNDYWSGYFTSRAFDKALDRQLERVLYAAQSLGASRYELQGPRREISLFQHHDGVTGTAKTPVVKDYAKRMYNAIQETQEVILERLRGKNTELAKLMDRINENASLEDVATADNQTTRVHACFKSDDPRGLTENMCIEEEPVFAFNPLLDTTQSCGSVDIRGGQVVAVSLPCENPGVEIPTQEGKAQFDSTTGMMAWPVKEEWLEWVVSKGGAYLFVPDRVAPFTFDDAKVEQDGYVVHTKFWRRTVVERATPLNMNVSVFDFIYEINLQEGNREWFVRFSADIENNKTFHTDLNGFNFDTHHRRDDLPIQSQVFPMPAHAAIQDTEARLTVLSEHAQGTASLKDGSIDVFLDRRLNQDDQRGLNQPVTDNVATRTRFRVVVEHEGFDTTPDAEFQITRFCREQWNLLNHPLELYGVRSNKTMEHLVSTETLPPRKPVKRQGTHPKPKIRTHGKEGVTPIYDARNRKRDPNKEADHQEDNGSPGYAAAYPKLMEELKKRREERHPDGDEEASDDDSSENEELKAEYKRKLEAGRIKRAQQREEHRVEREKKHVERERAMERVEQEEAGHVHRPLDASKLQKHNHVAGEEHRMERGEHRMEREKEQGHVAGALDTTQLENHNHVAGALGAGQVDRKPKQQQLQRQHQRKDEQQQDRVADTAAAGQSDQKPIAQQGQREKDHSAGSTKTQKSSHKLQEQGRAEPHPKQHESELQ